MKKILPFTAVICMLAASACRHNGPSPNYAAIVAGSRLWSGHLIRHSQYHTQPSIDVTFTDSLVTILRVNDSVISFPFYGEMTYSSTDPTGRKIFFSGRHVGNGAAILSYCVDDTLSFYHSEVLIYDDPVTVDDQLVSYH